MRRTPVFLLLAITLLSGAVNAQSHSTVEERMTGAEYQAAGLHKLTAEELAALNAWLQKQSGRALATSSARAAAAPAEDRSGFENAARHTVTSRIAGEFKGWNGGTRFVLENGQEWVQTDAAVLTGIKTLTNPAVTIKPGMFSGWLLNVEGYNSTTRVKRVK